MSIDPMLFKRKHEAEMEVDDDGESKPLPAELIAGVPAPKAPNSESPTKPGNGEQESKTGPEFKDQLDKLDQLIQAETGINQFNMDYVRGYVRNIMMDLKNQPDLDAILIDRDVHNILHFIRTVKDSASLEKVEKKEKRAVKSAKKSRIKVDFGSGDLPAGLADLGNLKV